MPIDLTGSVFIDNHAHSLLKRHLEVDTLGFRKPFTESHSLSFIQTHVPNSLHYINMLERLREVINFDTEEQLIDLRQGMTSAQHVNELWDDASIGALLVDDGYMQETMLSVNELAKLCERPVYRILRLEQLFEKLITECDSIQAVAKRLETELAAAVDTQVVGLKSIAAYRGGLPAVSSVDLFDRQESFTTIKRELESERKKAAGDPKNASKFRIVSSPLYHFLLLAAFDFAAKAKLPIQIHAGIGDSDLVLHQSNPSIMTPILKDKRFAACQFVFLHCYPYHRETSYLCSVFSNCYMDLSLSVILLSAVAKNILRETMALAPATKLLAGSDGHSVPEMHWYGATVFKEALQMVLNDFVAERYLPQASANWIAERVLYRNCRELYQLDGLL
jgi:hypothetical protein